MSEHKAQICWERGVQDFIGNRYSRAHKWKFDGGMEVDASSSPLIVPLPYSNSFAIDPEEAFVASIASCHMLWFLSIAAKKKFCIDIYTDDAYGIMKKSEAGYSFIDIVVLKPKTLFSGNRLPTHEDQAAMHEEAHQCCFIANSVKSDIRCEPIYS